MSLILYSKKIEIYIICAYRQQNIM
jgi:hypothetical protein